MNADIFYQLVNDSMVGDIKCAYLLETVGYSLLLCEET